MTSKIPIGMRLAAIAVALATIAASIGYSVSRDRAARAECTADGGHVELVHGVGGGGWICLGVNR